MNRTNTTLKSFASVPQLWIGLTLIAFFWPLNWFLDGLRTHLLFFPLWLGYALAVDGLVWLRKGSSLLRRNWRAYAGLFLVSAPFWWLFEAVNVRTQNWLYLGEEQIVWWLRVVLRTLSFSTVIPAAFGTAELVSTWGRIRRLPKGPVIRPTRPVLVAFFLAGVASFLLLMVWPRIFFPFVWLSIYFMVAAANAALGYRSLGRHTAAGDWRPAVALMLGTLICGFFWELWNYYAFPKWVYDVPPFEFLYIFEMPLLGYGGYLPFGLELFALYHFLIGVLGARRLDDYVQL